MKITYLNSNAIIGNDKSVLPFIGMEAIERGDEELNLWVKRWGSWHSLMRVTEERTEKSTHMIGSYFVALYEKEPGFDKRPCEQLLIDLGVTLTELL